MNRLPVTACLETRWLPTARRVLGLLGPLAAAGRVPAPELGAITSQTQTRRLHQQSHCRSVPARPLATQCASPRCRTQSAVTITLPVNSTTTRPFSSTPQSGIEPTIHPLWEPATSTWQYVVADPLSSKAVIIDPVLDYDNCTRTVTTSSADALLDLIKSRGYTITHILETHAHADHLTAAFYLQRKLAASQGVKPSVGIGKRIGQVQSLFGKRYGIASEEYDGVFDLLFEDDECFEVGQMKVQAVHLPGHTPDHMGYWIGDNVFCGDSLFHPTLGTARCDFPGGSANALYHSARKLLSLPDHVKVWVGHDYPVDGERDPEPCTSVGEHRQRNKHLRDGISEEEFVEMRKERDSKLAAPRLVHESLQVNIRAGQLPKVDEDGMRAFKLPVKVQAEGL
ncbi:hypothetical protein VTI74DRAFT_756 [Chaetomium olivicolor]